MIDRTRCGRRCRTIQFVRTVEGDLRRDARGTIRYETENLGRSLVMVDWDQLKHDREDPYIFAHAPLAKMSEDTSFCTSQAFDIEAAAKKDRHPVNRNPPRGGKP